jgi:AcrR family transcriptional regulator
VPKLWEESIQAHRAAVHDRVLDAAARLVHRHGPAGITMARMAREAGIGRATLYKYFPDAGAVLAAWHRRQVGEHVAELAALRNAPGRAIERLGAVLAGWARLAQHGAGNSSVVAGLHTHDHVEQAEQQLLGMLTELLAEAAEAGDVRCDVAAAELAVYCRYAATGAAALPSAAAVQRLVAVTLAGLAPAG